MEWMNLFKKAKIGAVSAPVLLFMFPRGFGFTAFPSGIPACRYPKSQRCRAAWRRPPAGCERGWCTHSDSDGTGPGDLLQSGIGDVLPPWCGEDRPQTWPACSPRRTSCGLRSPPSTGTGVVHEAADEIAVLGPLIAVTRRPPAASMSSSCCWVKPNSVGWKNFSFL